MSSLFLIDKDDSAHSCIMRIPVSGTVQAEPETMVGDLDRWTDFYDLLAELMYQKFGVEPFYAWVVCDWSGDVYDPTDYFVESNQNTIINRMGGHRQYLGTKTGNFLPEWNYISFSLLAGTYWYLAGSDPDTRWYVKFDDDINGRYGFRIYDHNLVEQRVQEWDTDITEHSAGSRLLYFVTIQSLSDLIGAATYQDAYDYEAKFYVESVSHRYYDNPETHVVEEQHVYGYRIWNSGSYYNWLWWLYNNGGGDPPTPEDPTEDDPYKGEYGPSGPGGGGGGRDPYDKGDPLPYWDKPPVSICDTGLITLYTPSSTQLHLLASDIWSSNFVSSLVKEVYADPIEVIISVGIVPFNVTPAGTKKIKVGERELDITSNYPADNYVIFDMGTVSLQEALGAYTDYAPYTKGSIYIPYVGFVPLDVDVFMGHSIGLKYMVDLCTGSATACLLVDSDVHQIFNCNLLTPVPLTSANYSAMWQSLLSVGSALVGMEAAGLAGASAAGEFASDKALQSGAKSASDIMTGISTKPIIQKSNSLAGSGGLVGCPYAFIQIEHPALAIPTNQNRFIGYPSYMNATLNTLQGYTRVSSIHLGIDGATKRELVDIENSLKAGVIIQTSGAVTATGIGLINTSDAPNIIGKKMSLVADLVGHFRAEVDIVNPVVTIERSSALGFNYVYIADFGRYYFVDEVRALRNNVLELHLSCDPLESFRTEILAHEAIIDKQEKVWNLYLNDDSLKSYQYPLVWQKKFPNAFWDNYEFVLVTAGA